MNSSSRNTFNTRIASVAAAPPTPALNASCDLCGGFVPMREIATKDGQILGLITCGQCIEDALAARTLETVQ